LFFSSLSLARGPYKRGALGHDLVGLCLNPAVQPPVTSVWQPTLRKSFVALSTALHVADTPFFCHRISSLSPFSFALHHFNFVNVCTIVIAYTCCTFTHVHHCSADGRFWAVSTAVARYVDKKFLSPITKASRRAPVAATVPAHTHMARAFHYLAAEAQRESERILALQMLQFQQQQTDFFFEIVCLTATVRVAVSPSSPFFAKKHSHHITSSISYHLISSELNWTAQ